MTDLQTSGPGYYYCSIDNDTTKALLRDYNGIIIDTY